ncbi:TPA: arginine repressor [Streptococcus suis]
MNKRERLELIKDLVVRYPIDTQEEIVERLEELGVHATQATVSRDIKELGIIKVPVADKGYIYGLPKAPKKKHLGNNVLEIKSMGQLISLQLIPGSSAVVKRQIWDQFEAEIFSILADDDSILIHLYNSEKIALLEETLKDW